MQRPKFLDEWRTILMNSWSIRMAAIMSTAAGALGAHEMIAVGLLQFLPPDLQVWGAAIVGLVVFGFPVITARLMHQKKLNGTS